MEEFVVKILKGPCHRLSEKPRFSNFREITLNRFLSLSKMFMEVSLKTLSLLLLPKSDTISFEPCR